MIDRKLRVNLRAAREEKGISRLELADAVDVRRETLGLIERGREVPSFYTALRIAETLSAAVEDIFSVEY